MSIKSQLLLGLFLTSVLQVGCADSPTNTKPKQTFKQAVTKLVDMRNTIRDGFAAGDVDKAHGPLHEVGHLLEELTGLAATSEYSSAQKASIESAKEELFNAFADVDKTLHGGEGSTYEEVASTIEAAMKTITDIAGVADSSTDDTNTNDTNTDDVPINDEVYAGEPIDEIDPIDVDEAAPGKAPNTELSNDG